MKRESGDWTRYRMLLGPREIDFHHGRRDVTVPYGAVMGEVYATALQAIKQAHADGESYVMLRHGASTSRPGQTTARSTIRGLIRSPVVTPYVNRRDSIQHDTVFVVAIKAPRPEATGKVRARRRTARR